MPKPQPTSKAASEWANIADIREWPDNPKPHDDRNVAEIARSIVRYGFTAPLVVWRSRGWLAAGHGRIKAAALLMREDAGRLLSTDAPAPGLVPVRYVEFASDAEFKGYALADNRLTEANPMDGAAVAEVLRAIEAEAGVVEVPGYSAEEVGAILAGMEQPAPEGGESKYTAKITAPIYEPKGERPPVADLYDTTKATDLRREIDAAPLPPDVAAFLRAAADRHTVFHFRRIAEFYAHAPPEIQALMERSALVIIDFDKAIEGGFVRLSERLAELAGIEEDAQDEG